MNKTELVDAVAQSGQIPRRTAAQVVDALFQAVTEALQRGDKVQLKDLGNFTVRERKARKGRNPKTGEEIEIAASRTVGFKAAKGVLEVLQPAETAEEPATAPAAKPGASPAQGDDGDDADAGRRHHARARLEIEVEYFLLDKFISDYTRNISRGGAFIRSNKQLEVGTELVFKLNMPGLDEPLSVKGKVAWTRTVEQAAEAEAGKDPGMGIQFVHETEEQRRAFERRVEALIDGPRPQPARSYESRRAHPRVPVELKVEYQNVDQLITEYTRNISRGGLFIRSDEQLEKGTQLLFKLHVPELNEPLSLKGRVAWVRTAAEATGSESPGMGVWFIYDSDEERTQLERTIDSLVQRQG